MVFSKILTKFRRIPQWQQVLLGFVLGILFGHFGGYRATAFAFCGTAFLNLIKMLIVPMIFFTIIYGMTSIKGAQGLYRVSIKAVVVFLLTALLAVIIGIILATLLKPGVGVDSALFVGYGGSTVGDSRSALSGSVLKAIEALIPANIIAAMAEGNILQIILFSLFMGIVLNIKRDCCENLVQICQQLAQVFFGMIEIVMKFAPLGVFGYVAATVGAEGLGMVTTLGKLIAVIIGACFIQYLVFGLLILLVGRLSPLPFYKKMVAPQLIAVSTSSSKATLVSLMQVAESKLGISTQSSRFLLPLSAILNMDGGALYQAVCAIFFVQVFNIELTYINYLTLLVMCTIASIGGAGIPGGVLLFLGSVLQSIGVPAEGVLLIASVDRILDMVTTAINVTGDACATLLVDKSEKSLDIAIYYKS